MWSIHQIVGASVHRETLEHEVEKLHRSAQHGIRGPSFLLRDELLTCENHGHSVVLAVFEQLADGVR